ncbi:MAG: rod shape-determining protein MreD, partial [Thermoleophilia bacterium]
MARLFAVLLVAVLLQTTIAPFVRILGANPDFVLILVVCVGLLRGPERGAGFGFLAGALVSLILF